MMGCEPSAKPPDAFRCLQQPFLFYFHLPWLYCQLNLHSMPTRLRTCAALLLLVLLSCEREQQRRILVYLPTTHNNTVNAPIPQLLVEAEEADILYYAKVKHIGGTDTTLVTNIGDGSYIVLKNIDLKGVKAIRFQASARVSGSFIEVRTGSPEGMLIGKADVTHVEDFKTPVKPTTTSITGPENQQDVYFVFHNSEGKKENIAIIDWIFFDDGRMGR
jgi:hypothetical protein